MRGKITICIDNLRDIVNAAVMNERKSLMPAFAVLLSGDGGIIERTRPDITEALESVPFEKLYYAPFFFAENTISLPVRFPGQACLAHI